MISKEEFVKAIEDIQRVDEYNSELNKLHHKYGAEGYLYPPDCTMTTINLLHNIFGVADKNEWISYFIFELDFGKEYKEGCTWDSNGNNIDLSTSDKLYDFLISINEERLNG